MHSFTRHSAGLLAAAEPIVADWLWPLLMLVGVVALGVIVALMTRRRPGASLIPAKQPESSRQASLLQQAQTMHQQMEDVRRRAAELIGTAQRLGIRMDEKAQRMRELLLLADEQIDAVTRTRPAPAALRAPSSPFRNTRAVQPAPAPATAVAIETKPGRVDPAGQRTRDARTRAICDLADLGREPLAIAKELREPVGTIELILALRNI